MPETPVTPLLRPLALLALVGLLAPPTAAQAQTTLVSNIGQDDSSTHNLQQSQAFTTGDNTPGYTLTSVSLQLAAVTGTDIKVRIFTVDSDGEPDTEVHVLTNPTSFTANAENTFDALANASLDAETTYAVVVTSSDGTDKPNGHNMMRTMSNAQDAGRASGWSIADERNARQTSSDPWSTTTSQKLKIKITGTAKAAAGTAATGQPGIDGFPQRGERFDRDHRRHRGRRRDHHQDLPRRLHLPVGQGRKRHHGRDRSDLRGAGGDRPRQHLHRQGLVQRRRRQLRGAARERRDSRHHRRQGRLPHRQQLVRPP